MEKNNIILIVIVVLVIALAAVAAYIYSTDNTAIDITNQTQNKTVIDVDKANNTTITSVGDNSTRNDANNNLTNNNTTYKVYNPQSDSYVPVIGEKFDDEVNRWYTYDDQGVRYYNTRIN